jgi:hypothetical protein
MKRNEKKDVTMCSHHIPTRRARHGGTTAKGGPALAGTRFVRTGLGCFLGPDIFVSFF